MPTPLAHLAVPLVARAVLGASHVPRALLAAGAFAAVVPDLDVVMEFFGIPDESRFAHRGFTHSLTFALLLASAWWLVARRRDDRRSGVAFAFVFACAVSHGVLDAFTNGGAGVGFLSPWSAERSFAPVQPIQVASVKPEKIFSELGLAIVRTELIWIWLPSVATAGLAIWRRQRTRPSTSPP
jgi:inner membrane protein